MMIDARYVREGDMIYVADRSRGGAGYCCVSKVVYVDRLRVYNEPRMWIGYDDAEHKFHAVRLDRPDTPYRRGRHHGARADYEADPGYVRKVDTELGIASQFFSAAATRSAATAKSSCAAASSSFAATTRAAAASLASSAATSISSAASKSSSSCGPARSGPRQGCGAAFPSA